MLHLFIQAVLFSSSFCTVDLLLISTIDPNLTIVYYQQEVFPFLSRYLHQTFWLIWMFPLLLSRNCKWELITFPNLGEVRKLPNLPVKRFNTQIQWQDTSVSFVLTDAPRHHTYTERRWYTRFSLLVIECCSCGLEMFSCCLFLALCFGKIQGSVVRNCWWSFSPLEFGLMT